MALNILLNSNMDFAKKCNSRFGPATEEKSQSLGGIELSNLHGVLLDVDGTLYHQCCLRFIIGIRFALFALIRPIKTMREIMIIRHYRRAQEWLRQDLSSDCLSPAAQLDRSAITTGISREEISTCVSEWMEKVPLRFLSICRRRRLICMIHCWDKLGVPIGVYSDYPAKNKLKKLGLQNIIHVVVCSEDADVISFKPDPRGFEIAAAKMGLTPSQVVYVGDREDVDAIGAKNAGMMPIIVRKSKNMNMTLKPKLTLAILDRQLKEIYAVKDYPSRAR